MRPTIEITMDDAAVARIRTLDPRCACQSAGLETVGSTGRAIQDSQHHPSSKNKIPVAPAVTGA